MRIAVTFLVAALAAGACSPRHVRPPARAESPETTLGRADALVEHGCYLCLEEALGLYRGLLGAGFRPALVRDRMVRTSVLMSAREREVGIVPPARPGEGPPATSPAAAAMYARAAATIPWRADAGARVFAQVDREAASTGLSEWRKLLAPPADAGDELAAYLLVALECSYAHPPPAAAWARAYADAHPSSLALAFRAASCHPVPGDERPLRAILAREPRFVEAEFLLGDLAGRRGEADEAEAHYRRVVEALPHLVGAPLALGDLLAEREEFEEALALYDQVLSLVPDHRDALLGRIACLSNLERHQDALAGCDEMIRLGKYFLGPAYYWRAWNLYATDQLDRAWEAIETAKSYLQTAQVFELSGVIAFDRRAFTRSRSDMEEALRRNRQMCRPLYYLGRLGLQAEQWAGAADYFVQGMACYREGAKATGQKMEEIRRSPLPAARKTRLLDRYLKQIEAAEHAAALAAYQAAVGYANAGMTREAIAQAELALGDGEMARPARELLAKLRK